MPQIDCRSCGGTLDVPDLLAAANLDCPRCDGKVFGASTTLPFEPSDPNINDPFQGEKPSATPLGGKIGMLIGALAAAIGMPLFAVYDDVNGRALVGGLGGAVIGVVEAMPDMIWGYNKDRRRYSYRNKYKGASLESPRIFTSAFGGGQQGTRIQELTPAHIFCGTIAGMVVAGFVSSLLGKWVAEFFD